MSLTYAQYLQLEKILSAQSPRSDQEHDEMLFIVIHQTYELWFKQILHELRFSQRQFQNDEVSGVCATLHRIRCIVKTMVQQIDVLETMTPLSFASFRERLETSSGFQSFQFRQFEFLMGAKNSVMLEFYERESLERRELERLIQEPTLYDDFLRFLNQRGHCVPPAILNRKYVERYEPSEAVQSILLNIYHHDSELTQLCERLVDLDEGVQEWRYRHVKMVERTIGHRGGTGGSQGAEYLKSTLFKPLFPDLWIIRGQF